MNAYKCKFCGHPLHPRSGAESVHCPSCRMLNMVRKPAEPLAENSIAQPYIFASYAHKDNDTVLPIIHAMQKDGFRVWYDSGIEVGTEWPAYIEKMVIGCRVFIIFLSDNAVDSSNCRKEINLAAELGKKVLVLQMDEQIDYKEYGMRLQLNTYQKLYVCRFAERKKLLAALHEASILHSCKTVGVPEPTAEPIAPMQQDSDRVKALVKRAFLFLEDGEREKADAYCEQALDLDPEYAPAYVVKTMLALGYTDIRDFENKCTEKLATHPAFSKALRFADDLYRTTLRHMEQQSNYNRAIALMQKGDMMSLCEAIVEFQSLEDAYADAADLRAQCQQKLDALTEEAKLRAEQENAEKPAVCVEVADAEDETADEYIALEPVPDKKDEDGLYRINVPLGENTQATAVQTASGKNLEEIRRRFSKQQGIIACGLTYTVGLNKNRTLVLSKNNYTQTLFDALNWTNITAVSGGFHIIGLKADGTVVTTGSNEDEQCQVRNWSNITAISGSAYLTVGLKADGTVVATGKNWQNQCAVTDWFDITAVACGYYHTVGLKADGTVIATGRDRENQCRVQEWTNIVAIAAGAYSTIGLKADGTVVATGYDEHGECNVADWEDITAIAAGDFHFVGLKSDGTVVAVGNNMNGQCDISEWRNIVAISCGFWHTVGVKADGTVVAVGKNDHGQCNVSDWVLF